MFFGGHHLGRHRGTGSVVAYELNPESQGTHPKLFQSEITIYQNSKNIRDIQTAQQVVKWSDQWLLYQESRTRSIHKQSTDKCIKEKWSLKHMRSILTCWLRLRIPVSFLMEILSPAVYTVKQWQPDLKHYIPMTIQNPSLLLKFGSKASNIISSTSWEGLREWQFRPKITGLSWKLVWSSNLHCSNPTPTNPKGLEGSQFRTSQVLPPKTLGTWGYLISIYRWCGYCIDIDDYQDHEKNNE